MLIILIGLLTLAATSTLFHAQPFFRKAFLPAALGALALFATVEVPSAFELAWLEKLGVSISLYVDGLAYLFLLMILWIGAGILFFAGHYFSKSEPLQSFYPKILLFCFAMVGIVTSDDLIVLFLFWELTSFTSYLLIGFDSSQLKARKAALQAFLVTGAGGLALLASFLILGNAAQSYSFVDILAQRDLLLQDPLILPAFILLLLGAFTKSAQVPFHFWLPGAMTAPAPVSAYLHSATMVKAGVFILAKFHPLFSFLPEWSAVLATFGLATFLWGLVRCHSKQELKSIFAYSTVSSLGLMVFLLSFSTPTALDAFLIFIVAHAAYKASLFMLVGCVQKEWSASSIEEMPAFKLWPPSFKAAWGMAVLSMIGMLPFAGFLAKELILESLLTRSLGLILMGIVGLSLGAWLVFRLLFVFKVKKDDSKPWAMKSKLLIPAMGLGLFSLYFGLNTNHFRIALIDPAYRAIAGIERYSDFALWHGVNSALILSLLTLSIGFLFTFWWPRGLSKNWLSGISAEAVFQRSLDLLIRGAQRMMKFVQPQSVTASTVWVVSIFVLVCPFYVPWPEIHWNLQFLGWDILSVTVFFLGAVFLSFVSKSRLAAILALGGIGYAIALWFALFSGPDLAATQFAVESLSAVIFALIVARLSKNHFSEKIPTMPRFLISLGGGLIAFATASLMTSGPSETVADFYKENSLAHAHGRNVVNVILVDFRALDTWGEITVLAIAALAVAALLKRGVTQ